MWVKSLLDSTSRVKIIKTVCISAVGIGAALTLLMTIGMLSIQYQQQAYAPRQCGGCVKFKKLTHELERNVMNAVIDSNSVPPSPVVRELLDAYNEKVVALFFTETLVRPSKNLAAKLYK